MSSCRRRQVTRHLPAGVVGPAEHRRRTPVVGGEHRREVRARRARQVVRLVENGDGQSGLLNYGSVCVAPGERSRRVRELQVSDPVVPPGQEVLDSESGARLVVVADPAHRRRQPPGAADDDGRDRLGGGRERRHRGVCRDDDEGVDAEPDE